MLLMVCGVLIAIIGGSTRKEWGFLLGLLIGAFVFCIGFLVPIHGYEEPLFQSDYQLSSIHPDITMYAVVDSDGSVTCKHQKEDDSYKAAMYTYETNVEFEYVDEGTKPVLVKYLMEPKKSILSMAVGSTKPKYVIYCPKNYIEIWQNKHIE